MSTTDDNFFDVIIVGTGLQESILAAALSKANYKVAHIDPNPYYGGDEASLSQEELVKWGEQVSNGFHAMFEGYSGTSDVLPYARQYSICLKPSVIPALGPLITGLIASGVAKYSGFKLLDSVSIYTQDGTIKSVPGSKEAIFSSKDISLIEKRRLMRFLTFAGGEFEGKHELQGKAEMPFQEFLKTGYQLSDPTIDVIVYALAHCVRATDPTLPSLLRMRGYLRSIGRYGPSPFLVGHYGGIGDVAQGFCRASAVNGGVYILGRTISSTTYHPKSESDGATQEDYIEVQLDDFPEVLKSRIVIASKQHSLTGLPLPSRVIEPPPPTRSVPSISKIARCVAILDTPLYFQTTEAPSTSGEEPPDAPPGSFPPVDTGLLVIPPGTIPKGSPDTAATVFVNGENSLSTPKNRWIVYITLPLTSAAPDQAAETVLKPYLNAVLKSATRSEGPSPHPLSSSFFFEKQLWSDVTAEAVSGDDDAPRCFVLPPILYTTFPDTPDNATQVAERAFQQAVRSLRSLAGRPVDEGEEIDFWPPIPADSNDSEDED